MTPAPPPEALREALAKHHHELVDPFTGKTVKISDDLCDRLRGRYACGPTLPNGEPEFGWREFETAPIQHEAAALIATLAASLAAMRAERDEARDKVAHWKAARDECERQYQEQVSQVERELDLRFEAEAQRAAARTECDALKAEIERLGRRCDAQETALHQIAQWADAYPIEVFPEPDLVKANALLDAGGMTTAGIAASAMRHVIEGVGKIARAALAPEAQDQEAGHG